MPFIIDQKLKHMKTRSFYPKICFLNLLKITVLLFFLMVFSYKARAYGDWWPHTAACYGTPVWLTACPMPSPDYCTLSYSNMITGPLRIGWWYTDANLNVRDMFTGSTTITYHLISDPPPAGHGSLTGNPFSDHSMIAGGGVWPNGSFTWLSPGIIPGDPGYEWVAGNASHVLNSSSQLASGSFSNESYNPNLYLAIQVPGTSHHVTCYGSCNGTITITPNGGSGNYPSYHWSNGETTQNVSTLCTGQFTVTVTDGNGCNTTGSYSITQPSLLAITNALVSNVHCYGNQDGFICLTVTGGTPIYTYIWNISAGTPCISSIGAGGPYPYTVTVTDRNSCTATGSYTITQPSLLAITNASVTHVQCYGNQTGCINITVSGGTPLYHYMWSNAAATKNICYLPAGGPYTVTVVDGNGCTAIGSYTITQPSVLSIINPMVTNVFCYGGNNGAISATASGGTQPYSYHWNTGATGAVLNGLPAGVYIVTVSDSHLCNVQATFNVHQFPDIVLNATIVPCACPGSCDGSVNLTVTGGCTPYNYLWSNGAVTLNIGNITASSYSVTVTDCAGCTKSASYTVTATSPVCQDVYLQNIVVTDVKCYSGVQKIFVAGVPPTNLTTFVVGPTGNVTLIAGQNIIYYPGITVYAGGYMWGYIAPCGPWCTYGPVSIVSVPPEPEPGNYPVSDKSFFTIYPNPTTGGFSLETRGVEESAQIKVEIYGMQGDRVFSANVKGKKIYDFSLSGKSSGVYFIRVVTGLHAGTGKIIKQ